MLYLLIIIGFISLIVGTMLLVNGASAIASRFRISNLAIGVTVVGFCTSAPELYAVLYADFESAKNMAVDIVLGSNIFNILFILGVSAIISPLIIRKNTVWKEIPMTLLAAAIIGIMANFPFPSQGSHILNRTDGLILLVLFGLFMWFALAEARKRQGKEEPQSKKKGPAKELPLVICGLALIAIGGKWGIDSVVELANTLGISQQTIGLTVVGIGTSVPELTASTLAARRGNPDLAIGSIIGSNIFNICFILGVGAIAKPLPLPSGITFNTIAAIIASAILFISVFIEKGKYVIQRWEGVVFLLLYSTYMAVIVYAPLPLN